MKLSAAIQSINDISSRLGYRFNQMDLVLKVFHPPAPGVHMHETPVVDIKSIDIGIDFDTNRIILTAKEDIPVLTDAERKALIAVARQGHTWHAHQVNRAQVAKILELEKHIERLQGTIQRMKGEQKAHEPAAISA